MKKLAIAALSIATCATVGIFAGCNNDDENNVDTSADISLMNYWKGNENEETYTVKTETSGELKISYEKSGEWQFAKRTFVEESEHLANMKTLVLEGSAVTNTNDPRMTLKIVYKGDTPDKEVHFDMSESKATYEWDLSNANMGDALNLMLFAEGTRVSATGTITINKFYLTKNAINQANNVEASKGDEVEKVVNDITSSKATVNGGWYDNGDGLYTVTKNGANYDVEYNKKSFAYGSMYAAVKGEAIKDYKTLRVTVNGEAGEPFRINLYTGANHESATYVLTGGDDEIVLDLTKFDLTEVDWTQEYKVILMAQFNTTDVTGSFTIKNATFSNEEAPVEEVKAVNTITTTAATLNGGWYDNGDLVYTINKGAAGYTVTYNKGNSEWGGMYALVTGEAIKDYKTLRVTIKGTAGEKFKTNLFTGGNHESDEFTLTGGDDVIVLDLTKFADLATVDYTQQHKVIIMAQPGTKTVNGEFTIKNAEFSMTEASATVTPPPPVDEKVVNTITAAAATLNGGWYDNNGANPVYTIEKGTDVYNVTYAKGNNSYGGMYATVTGEAIKTYKTLRITIKGTAGEKFKTNFYVGGNHESDTFTLTGGDDVIILDITPFVANVDGATNYKVIIMAQPGTTDVTGSFTVKNATFSNEAAPAPENPKVVNTITATDATLNGGWYDNNGATPVYTIEEGDDGYDVTYDKGSSQWGGMYATVTGEAIKDYKTLRITIKGTAGEVFKTNFYVGGNHESAAFTLTGEEDEIVLDITPFVTNVNGATQYKVIIMAQPGTTGVNGTFTIVNAEFSATPATPAE